jgi:hypothetical protein
MTTKELYVEGIVASPDKTAWAWLMVPRMSIFSDDRPQILEWDYDELDGCGPAQATLIARMARELQGLAYKTGPALVTDDGSTIGAMLSLLQYQGRLGDCSLCFQSRGPVFNAMTDSGLQDRGLWVEDSPLIRDAVRHAITTLQCANNSRDYALSLWPYPPNGVA